MNHKLSLTEITQKTMKILGTTNPDDVSYITDDYLSDDFKELPQSSKGSAEEIENLTYYGHSMSYGYMEGVGDVYNFLSGSDPTNINTVCGNSGFWAAFSHWDHYRTDKNCGSAEYQRVLKFVNKFQ